MKVQGLNELAKGLDQFKKSTAAGVLNRALKKAAKPVEAAAKRNAPVDQGELRDSISTQTIRRNAGKSAYASAMRGGATKAEAGAAARDANQAAAGEGASATVRVRAAARHAGLVEWGTQKMPAQPFLGPALRSNQGAVLASIKGELATEIEKTAKRVASRAAKKGSSK